MIQTISIGGMTCTHCQNVVKKAIKGLSGVEEAAVSYNFGTAKVTYDEAALSLKEIHTAIENAGYSIQTGKRSETVLHIIGNNAIKFRFQYLSISKNIYN